MKLMRLLTFTAREVKIASFRIHPVHVAILWMGKTDIFKDFNPFGLLLLYQIGFQGYIFRYVNTPVSPSNVVQALICKPEGYRVRFPMR
jgi:hypothetical protein